MLTNFAAAFEAGVAGFSSIVFDRLGVFEPRSLDDLLSGIWAFDSSRSQRFLVRSRNFMRRSRLQEHNERN